MQFFYCWKFEKKKKGKGKYFSIVTLFNILHTMNLLGTM